MASIPWRCGLPRGTVVLLPRQPTSILQPRLAEVIAATTRLDRNEREVSIFFETYKQRRAQIASWRRA